MLTTIKKLALATIGSILLVTAGCKKDVDDVLGATPDQRLNSFLANAQKTLVNENGWKALVYMRSPLDSGKYLTPFFYYLSFNDSNRVTMLSTQSVSTATNFATSGYRLKALQQPTIIFDTYSYLTSINTPDAISNYVALLNAFGLPSRPENYPRPDVQYRLDSVSADRIVLTGSYYGTRIEMTRASAEDATQIRTGKIGSNIALLSKYNNILNYFKGITLGGKTYQVKNLDLQFQQITLGWLDGSGKPTEFKTGYYYTLHGLTFSQPFLEPGSPVTEIMLKRWDSVNAVIHIAVNGAESTIRGINTPVVYNPQDAKDFLNEPMNMDFANAYFGGYAFHYLADGWTMNLVHRMGVDYGPMTYYGTSITYFRKYTPDTDLLAAGGFAYIRDGILTLDAPFATYSPIGPREDKSVWMGMPIATGVLYGGNAPAINLRALSEVQKFLNEPDGFYVVKRYLNGNSLKNYDFVSKQDGRNWNSFAKIK